MKILITIISILIMLMAIFDILTSDEIEDEFRPVAQAINILTIIILTIILTILYG